MKYLNFCLIILNLFFPAVALANTQSEYSIDRPKISQLDTEETEATGSETEDTDAEETSEKEESDTKESEAESEDEERAEEPTPAEIARLEKLAAADKLYQSGNKAEAVKLYRSAKPTWDIEEKVRDNNSKAIAFSDPDKLSPAGKVFWRNYQQGKQQQLETKTISSLKLLTTREPQFIPGHIHYADALLKYEREAESLEALNYAYNQYPNEPEILRAKMNADIAADKWLDASIMARQYALFNPDSPQAREFERLADEYLAEYQSNLRESITWNAIGNAIAGTVGFALTGNLFSQCWLCCRWSPQSNGTAP